MTQRQSSRSAGDPCSGLRFGLPDPVALQASSSRGFPSRTASSGNNEGPLDFSADNSASTAPRKRRGPTERRMAYPRKRAVTACQLCRIRKAKCDNQRPCGTCKSLDLNCVYQDPSSDHSTFDQASLTILDRLNYAVQLLENQSQVLTAVDLLAASQSPAQPSTGSFGGPAIAQSETQHASAPLYLSVEDHQSPLELRSDNSTTLNEALDVSADCSCSHVLLWPIFQGRINPDDIDAPFFDSEYSEATRSDAESRSGSQNGGRIERSFKPGRGIHEEDVQMLIHKFLNNVHTKNPILDPAALQAMARRISEDGFGWDGHSCLVLIACALASLADPFHIDRPQIGQTSWLDVGDYATAESYYTAARKRSGLLDNSVLATQCTFLMGVYEMYSIRPWRAWLSFNHACTSFQAYLRTPSRRLNKDRSSKRLEQRLYWSCLKSECEMRDEIDLPPTGLAKVEYPDIFPSPPGGTPDADDSGQTVSPGTLELTYQQSWYYYLSEIALRRIANRITHTLHAGAPQIWLTTPLKRLLRIAEELDAQIQQWAEHVPSSLVIDNENPSEELPHMLHGRFLSLRERIWRPFLYLEVHATRSQAEPLFFPARQCLDLVLKCIDHASIKHRHHGSWYGARGVFTMALLVCAAVKSGNIELPLNWRESIEATMLLLQYWEAEGPDVRVMRLALIDVYSSLDHTQ